MIDLDKLDPEHRALVERYYPQKRKEGDTVPITLTFDDGSKTSIEVPVRNLQNTMPASHATGR